MSDEPTKKEEEKVIDIFSRKEEKPEPIRLPYIPNSEDYTAFLQVVAYVASLSPTNVAKFKIDEDSLDIIIDEFSEEETEDFQMYETVASKKVTVFVDDWENFVYDIGDNKETFAEMLEVIDDVEQSVSTLVVASGNAIEERDMDDE